MKTDSFLHDIFKSKFLREIDTTITAVIEYITV